MTTPTVNLKDAQIVDDSAEFTVIDESNIRHIYGGRYGNDEYIQVDDGNGKKNMHNVTINLMLDHAQFISLMNASDKKEKIIIQMV